MDERLKFIARLLDGEKMAGLCREFGISRKTGYKILTRYNEIGLEGLTDRSRRSYRHAKQLPIQIEIIRSDNGVPFVAVARPRRSFGRHRSASARAPLCWVPGCSLPATLNDTQIEIALRCWRPRATPLIAGNRCFVIHLRLPVPLRRRCAIALRFATTTSENSAGPAYPLRSTPCIDRPRN
jgi:hypothetical protein